MPDRRKDEIMENVKKPAMNMRVLLYFKVPPLLIFAVFVICQGCAGQISQRGITRDVDHAIKEFDNEKYFNAIQQLEKALSIDYSGSGSEIGHGLNRDDIYTLLGVCYQKMGQFENAINNYNRALSSNISKSAEALSHAGIGFSLCSVLPFESRGGDEFQDGIEELNLAIDLTRDNEEDLSLIPIYTLGRGMCNFRKGAFIKAIKDIDYCLVHNNDEKQESLGNAQLHKIFTLFGLGETEMAREGLMSHDVSLSPFEIQYYEALIDFLNKDGLADNGMLLKHPFVGVWVSSASINNNQGMYVSRVFPGGPAERSGILPGDLILSVNNKKVSSGNLWSKEIEGLTPGMVVAVVILRNNLEKNLSVKIGSRFEQAGIHSEGIIGPFLNISGNFSEADKNARQGNLRKAYDLYMDAGRNSGFDFPTMRKIIDLVKKLDPPPTITQDAIKQATIASFAAQNAKNERGYDRAINEFNKALRLAPWVSSLHWNLALMHEACGNFFEASLYLKLYKTTLPSDSQDFTVDARIAELQFQAEEHMREAREKRKEETKLAKEKAELARKKYNACIQKCWVDYPFTLLRPDLDIERANCERRCSQE
jgi:Tfp pilus assembly protein PilF